MIFLFSLSVNRLDAACFVLIFFSRPAIFFTFYL
jgi:hypothetical protein